METKELAMVGGAAGLGALQPFLIKKYLLPDATPVIAQLGRFGSMGSLVNYGLAATAIGLAAVGAYMRKGPLVNQDYQTIAIAYGVPALVSGLFSDYTAATATMSFRPQVRRMATASVRGMPSASVRGMPSATVTASAPRVVGNGTRGTTERGVF